MVWTVGPAVRRQAPVAAANLTTLRLRLRITVARGAREEIGQPVGLAGSRGRTLLRARHLRFCWCTAWLRRRWCFDAAGRRAARGALPAGALPT